MHLRTYCLANTQLLFGNKALSRNNWEHLSALVH